VGYDLFVNGIEDLVKYCRGE